MYTGGELPVFDQRDALPSWGHALEIELADPEIDSGPETPSKEECEAYNAFVVYFTCLMVATGEAIQDELCRYLYLGPLRETPAREFAPPRFADPSRWSSGLGAWDELMNGPDDLVDSTGQWLGDEDKLNSGYRVERRRFKEVDLADPLIVKLQSGRAFDEADADSRLQLEKYPTKSRLLIVASDSDIDLQPHDVGIGISQVVPVVVTALYGKNRLVAIEQPELHLHPKLQAELGDLFIESALGDRRHVVMLETHSEHLILRILRRIRETTDDELPPQKLSVTSDDVSVYYLQQSPYGVRAIRLDVDETGEFVDRWPEGFFEERSRELF